MPKALSTAVEWDLAATPFGLDLDNGLLVLVAQAVLSRVQASFQTVMHCVCPLRYGLVSAISVHNPLQRERERESESARERVKGRQGGREGRRERESER